MATTELIPDKDALRRVGETVRKRLTGNNVYQLPTDKAEIFAVGDFLARRAFHELAEGHMRHVVVAPVADDEIHRHVERPFDIVGKAEVGREAEFLQARALVVGVAPDLATPRLPAVRPPFRER